MATIFAALLSFGVPAILSHIGVAATASTLLSGAVGSTAATAIAGAGTKAAGGLIAKQLGGLLHHIAEGGEVTTEHRQFINSQRGVSWHPPKYEPGQPTGPVTWTTPKA